MKFESIGYDMHEYEKDETLNQCFSCGMGEDYEEHITQADIEYVDSLYQEYRLSAKGRKLDTDDIEKLLDRDIDFIRDEERMK